METARRPARTPSHLVPPGKDGGAQLLCVSGPGLPSGPAVKDPPANTGDMGSTLGWEDALEKEMDTHSSIVAWEMPWTEEPGGLGPWGHKESDTTEHIKVPTLPHTTGDMLSKLLHLPTAKVCHVQSGGNKACRAVATAKMNLD